MVQTSQNPLIEISRGTGKSRADHLFTNLREDILNGRLEPGAKLNIAALRQAYKTGLSPLREALTRLAAMNLLVQQSQRGFSVPTLEVRELEDIINLRAEFEGIAAETSVQNGNTEWESEVLAAGHRLKFMGETTYKSRDWEDCHKAFHAILLSRGHSPWRLRFTQQLHDQFDRYRRQAPHDSEIRSILNEQHYQMVELALARNGNALQTLVIDHIRLSAEVARRCCQQ